jgi:hypothetical protein
MKVLFIHIPKTAGTSIREWVHVNKPDTLRCFGHVPYHEVIKEYNEFDWSFTVVRNTYERMVSLYLYSWNKSKRRMEKAIKRGEVDQQNTFVVEQAEKGIIPFYKSFLDESRPELNEGLLISQLEYSNGVNYILDHNTLDQDLKIVQEKLNVNAPLTQMQNYMATEDKKKQYYTPEFLSLIEKHYGEEIEKFKYSHPK